MSTSILATVTGEFYTVDGIQHTRFEYPTQAVKAAMSSLIESGANCTTVRRVATHDPVDGGIFGMRTETQSGEVLVWGPSGYAWSPELTRYDANAGWRLPETIEVPVLDLGL